MLEQASAQKIAILVALEVRGTVHDVLAVEGHGEQSKIAAESADIVIAAAGMAVGHDKLFDLFRNAADFLNFLAEAGTGGHAAANGTDMEQHFLDKRLLGSCGHGGLHLFLCHRGSGFVGAHDNADVGAQVVGSLEDFLIHFSALHIFGHEGFGT